MPNSAGLSAIGGATSPLDMLFSLTVLARSFTVRATDGATSPLDMPFSLTVFDKSFTVRATDCAMGLRRTVLYDRASVCYQLTDELIHYRLRLRLGERVRA